MILGITTLAPERMPCRYPSGASVANAVVAGISALGCISRAMAMTMSVSRKSLTECVPNGVLGWGMNVPIPII